MIKKLVLILIFIFKLKGIFPTECSSKNNNSYQIPIYEKMMYKTVYNTFNSHLSIKDLVKYLKKFGSYSGSIYTINPFIIFLIVGIVFGILLIFLSICQVFCIKKHRVFTRCCYMDINKETKSKAEKFCLFIGIILVSILVLICCIFSLFNSDLKNGFNNSYCELNQFQKDLIKPNYLMKRNSNFIWPGVINIEKSLIKLKLAINNKSNLLRISKISKKINVGKLNRNFKKLRNFLFSIYYKNKNKQIVNPDPKFRNKKISSIYISILGPPIESGTTTNILLQELLKRKNILENIENLKHNSEKLSKKHVFQFKADYLKLRKYIFQLNFYANEFNNHFKGNNFKWRIIFWFLKLFFILNILSAIMSIIGFIFVGFNKTKFCACFMHLSWILSMVLFTIGFFSLLIVYLSGLRDSSICRIYSQILTKENFLDQNFNKDLSQNFRKNFRNSLFGSQNFLSSFKSKNRINILKNINEEFKNLEALSLPMEMTLSKINNYRDILKKFLIAGGKNNHPNVVLQKFNLWSNYEISGSLQNFVGKCEITKDEWVFRKKDCKYTNIYLKVEIKYI